MSNNPCKEESLSGSGLSRGLEFEEITTSNLLGFTGRGGGDGSSRAHHHDGHSHCQRDFVTPKTLQLLQDHFQRETALQRDELKKVEEKCNVILVKVPVLESRTENVGALIRELELEREQRRDNEKSFMECIDRLMKEIVQVNLKLVVLEERIEEMENKRGHPPSPSSSDPRVGISVSSPQMPPPPSSSAAPQPQECGNEVVGLINDLSKDIQAKFHEFGETQATLRVKIENTRKDLMDSMSYNMLPPVEAILEEPPPLPPQATSSFPPSGRDSGYGGGPGDPTAHAFGMPGYPMTIGGDSYGPTTDPGYSGGDATFAEPPGEGDGDGIDFFHGQAPTPGRYLPVLCLCGMEYDSLASLSAHIVEEVTSRHVPPHPGPSSGPGGPSGSGSTSSKRGRGRPKSKSSAHGMAPETLDPDGKPRFHCICGNSCRAKRNMDHHLRVHLSGRVFQCTLCPSKQVSLGKLRNHMKTQHRQTEFCEGMKSCSICGQIFGTTGQLFSHQAEAHGITRFPANPAKI